MPECLPLKSRMISNRRIGTRSLKTLTAAKPRKSGRLRILFGKQPLAYGTVGASAGIWEEGTPPSRKSTWTSNHRMWVFVAVSSRETPEKLFPTLP
jgi:hypothetical protein